MDPDMNKYDLEHVCTGHPLMSEEAWKRVYRDAWKRYYTDEHVETVLRRAVASGHQAQQDRRRDDGLLRRRADRGRASAAVRLSSAARSARSAGTACRSSIRWCSIPWRAVDFVARGRAMAAAGWRYHRIKKRVVADPATSTYVDDAMRPVRPAMVTDHFVEVFADKIPKTHGAPTARHTAAPCGGRPAAGDG